MTTPPPSDLTDGAGAAADAATPGAGETVRYAPPSHRPMPPPSRAWRMRSTPPRRRTRFRGRAPHCRRRRCSRPSRSTIRCPACRRCSRRCRRTSIPACRRCRSRRRAPRSRRRRCSPSSRCSDRRNPRPRRASSSLRAARAAPAAPLVPPVPTPAASLPVAGAPSSAARHPERRRLRDASLFAWRRDVAHPKFR